jgi:hypothetical protein
MLLFALPDASARAVPADRLLGHRDPGAEAAARVLQAMALAAAAQETACED